MSDDPIRTRETNEISDYIAGNSGYFPMEGDLTNLLKPNQTDNSGRLTLASYSGNSLISTFNKADVSTGDVFVSERPLPGYIHFGFAYSGKNKKVKVTDLKVVNQRNKAEARELKAIEKAIKEFDKHHNKTLAALDKQLASLTERKAQLSKTVHNIGKLTKKAKKKSNKLKASVTTDELSIIEKQIASVMKDIRNANRSYVKQMTSFNNAMYAVGKKYDKMATPLKDRNARIFNYSFENNWFRSYKLNDHIYGKKFLVRYSKKTDIKDPAADYLKKVGSPKHPAETLRAVLPEMLPLVFGQVEYSDMATTSYTNERTELVNLSGKFVSATVGISVKSLGEDCVQSCTVTCIEPSGSIKINTFGMDIHLIAYLTTGENIRINVKNKSNTDITVKYAIAQRSKT